jgi:hypothetical protein
MSSSITNRGAIHEELQNVLNMDGGDYNSLEDRIESRITEYDLEGELTNYRESLINEGKDFEESLQFTNIVEDYNTGDNSEYYESRPYMSDRIIFTINHRLDYIKNIYLEIDLEESFHGLTLEEKIDLFNMDVQLETAGNRILNSTILVCLISQLCADKHINTIENKLQIPILSFGDGLDVCSMNYNDINVIIGTKNSYKFRKTMRLLCIGGYYNRTKKISVLYNEKYSLILQSDINEYGNIKNNKYIDISANKLSKALFLYFIPKNIDNISTSPNITSVKVKLDNLEPIEYTSDNLNSIDILGIFVYIVSFSEEFDTIEGIKMALTGCSKNISCSGINLSKHYKTLIMLDGDYNLEDYTMFLTPIQLNILKGCYLKFVH